ncbi:hypothetical protein CCHR01_15066 [Colletotrichum chrysophilum]|uniref:Uncharacterized protein n=1 Tax=Colletotrichum chrysophilum TaxID=1836956 RepID=A0AAD9A6V1_9PEZI|nr:hypothetical protein CCHR01_15066 [Colletotrichum chrysophilum]
MSMPMPPIHSLTIAFLALSAKPYRMPSNINVMSMTRRRYSSRCSLHTCIRPSSMSLMPAHSLPDRPLNSTPHHHNSITTTTTTTTITTILQTKRPKVACLHHAAAP